MKDITNEKLQILADKQLNIGYNYKGMSVQYAKADIAVVKNPYTNEIDIAVRPFVKNTFGEFFPLYSYEEDIQYQYCMQVATKCTFSKEPIPDDVDTFVRALMQKKEFAREQADDHVRKYMPNLPQDASTCYTRSTWREDVCNCAEARDLMDEYHKSLKKK